MTVISKRKKIPKQSKRNIQKSTKELRKLKATVKRLREQLLQAERMSALGEISGYVAHEIRNYASMIQNTSEEAEKDPSTDNVQLAIEVSIQVAEKLLKLSKSISDYFKGVQVSFESASPVKALEDTIVMVQNSLRREGIQIIKNFQAHSRVSCDVNQLQQVFINLIVNATDALAGKKDGIIQFESTEDDDYLYIKITDNGCGMTDRVKRNAFQPFFSTKTKKRESQNAGIGLSVCRDIIVKRHLGRLRLTSSPKKGTTFMIALSKKHKF